MLFQELNKLKWNTVMSSIVLMVIGIFMVICPDNYVKTMIGALGAVLLIFAVLGVLEFISSNKALIHYIRLFVGLLAGMAGVLLFSADGLFLALLNWLVGTLPILLGGYGLYHALMYARRSGRSGWWVLVILSCLLLLFGTILFVNPWADDPRKVLYVIGGTLFYSAVVYAISLFWIWPFRRDLTVSPCLHWLDSLFP
jgi:uncharacterized membrane protein HdeD (DUF308 family)